MYKEYTFKNNVIKWMKRGGIVYVCEREGKRRREREREIRPIMMMKGERKYREETVSVLPQLTKVCKAFLSHNIPLTLSVTVISSEPAIGDNDDVNDEMCVCMCVLQSLSAVSI